MAQDQTLALQAIAASIKRTNAVTLCQYVESAYKELETLATVRYDTPCWTQFEGTLNGQHWQVNARRNTETIIGGSLK